MSDIRTYQVDSYAVFLNVDESILKLNSFIEPLGFRFICLGLEELEASFASFFGVRADIYNKDADISEEFWQAMIRHPTLKFELLQDRRAVMLQKIEGYTLKVIDGKVDDSENIRHLGAIQSFSDNLLLQLRLFKNEWIDVGELFQMGQNEMGVRHMRVNSSGRPNSAGYSERKYALTEEEMQGFQQVVVENFQPNSLTKLAFENYILTYQIPDAGTEYVTLMTCLESLFNHGADQISHTISRHLALIISADKDEFQRNFSRIKKLYGYRSKIVHGDKTKEDIVLLCGELKTLVRRAINYCLQRNMSKDDLFNELNATGFPTE